MFKSMVMILALGLVVSLGTAARGDPILSRSGASSGFGFAASERWGVTEVSVDNAGEREFQAKQVMATVSFPKSGEMANVQFARPIWMPPKSRRDVSIPFRAPLIADGKERSIDVEVLLLDTARPTDHTWAREAALMRVEHRFPVMAAVMGAADLNLDLASTVKKLAGGDPAMAFLRGQRLPEFAAPWRGVDSLILADPDLTLNTAQRQAIKQWLVSGGRAWILLDQVNWKLIQELMGDPFRVIRVDEVELPGMAIEPKDMFGGGDLGSPRPGKEKLKQPQTWEVAKGVSGDALHVRNGLTRMVRQSGGPEPRMQRMMDVDPRWSSVRLGMRVRVVKLETVGAGAEASFQFLDAAGTALGDPTVFGVNQKSRGVDQKSQQVDVPSGATKLAVTLAFRANEGEAEFNSVTVEPLELKFAKPAKMTRVVTEGMAIDREINGYPARFHCSVGQGVAIFTTVSPSLWMAEMESVQNTLDDLVRDLTRRAPQSPLSAEQLLDLVRYQIGHSVIPRAPVAVVLAVFVMVLLGVGLWFHRAGRLEYLAAAGAGLAVLTGGILLGLGAANRAQTPLTIASAQLVRVYPDVRMATIDGSVGVYSPEGGMGPLSATAGGVLWPDRTGQQGRLLRMVWTDLEHWTWDFLQLPAGAVRASELAHSVPLDQPVRVEVTVDDHGVVGTVIPGAMGTPEDALLCGPAGALPVQLLGENKFRVDPAFRLAEGQYLSGGSLSATQTRRLEVYRQLLDNSMVGFERSMFPDQPMLLWWTRPMDLGFSLPQQAERRETAIAAVPLSYRRPKSGQRVVIPAPLVTYEADRGGASASTTVFNNLTGQWIGQLSAGASARLRVQIPRTLMPLKLESLHMVALLRAPARKIEILDQRGEVLATFDGPLRPVTCDIPATPNLALGPDGTFIVTLNVADIAETSQQLSWEIRGLEIDVVATVP